MKALKFLAIIFFFLLNTSVLNAQSILDKWEYDHLEFKAGNKEINTQLFGADISTENEKPIWITFYKDMTFIGTYIRNHKQYTKFGTYRLIADGKYIEITITDENNNTKIERHEIIELNEHTLKLKNKVIYVYNRVK